MIIPLKLVSSTETDTGTSSFVLYSQKMIVQTV